MKYQLYQIIIYRNWYLTAQLAGIQFSKISKQVLKDIKSFQSYSNLYIVVFTITISKSLIIKLAIHQCQCVKIRLRIYSNLPICAEIFSSPRHGQFG